METHFLSFKHPLADITTEVVLQADNATLASRDI